MLKTFLAFILLTGIHNATATYIQIDRIVNITCTNLTYKELRCVPSEGLVFFISAKYDNSLVVINEIGKSYTAPSEKRPPFWYKYLNGF